MKANQNPTCAATPRHSVLMQDGIAYVLQGEKLIGQFDNRPNAKQTAEQFVRAVNEYEALCKVAQAQQDSADFIAAIAEATAGGGQIDKNSIMRFGETLATTAKKLKAKNEKALANLAKLKEGMK